MTRNPSPQSQARWQAGLPAAGIVACLPCFGGGSSSTSAATTQQSTQDNFGVSDTAQGAAGDNNTQNRDSNNTVAVDASTSTWQQDNSDRSTFAQDNSDRSTFAQDNSDRSTWQQDNSDRSTSVDASSWAQDNSVRNTDNSSLTTTDINASDNRVYSNTDARRYDASNRSTNNTNITLSDAGAIKAGSDLAQSAIASNFGISGKVVDTNAAMIRDLMSKGSDFLYKAQQQAQDGMASSLSTIQALSRNAIAGAQETTASLSGNANQKLVIVGVIAAVALGAAMLKKK